jgi:uncharacterized phage protein (TIGR02218 family)
MKDVSEQITNLENRRTRKPVDIYDFWNDTLSYYITSADEVITYNGQSYTPAMIGRERTGHSSNLTVSKLSINVDKLQDEVKSYLESAPLDETWVRIMRVFRNQTPREAMVYFVGTLNMVSIKGQSATLQCDGLEKFLTQLVPRHRYQRLCGLTLYGPKCMVDKTTYKETVALSAISADGLTITGGVFGGKDTDYYAFGWVEFEGYKRMVVSNSGNNVVLRHYIPGLTDSDTVDIYPGCDKTMPTCRDKFSNLGGTLDTFFGWPYMPYDNPALWT